MDFFPFKPYYYPQNRYMPYGGMQGRGVNPNYQQRENRRRNTSSKVDEHAKSGYEERKSYETNETRRDIPKLDKFDKPIFEIFGLKLYFDDILIISLIFFLYNEGVRDNLLFMSLILLLLS